MSSEVWMAGCEKSIWRIFWQSVYVYWALRETVPYHNCVYMTVCLWLFTEVWVGRETWAWKFALTESEMEVWNGNVRGGWGECSLWHGAQALIMYSDGSQCLVFCVRVAGGYIPLRRWYFNNTCSICVTSFDTALRWAQEGGSDESCLHSRLQASAVRNPDMSTNTLNVNQGWVYRAVA